VGGRGGIRSRLGLRFGVGLWVRLGLRLGHGREVAVALPIRQSRSSPSLRTYVLRSGVMTRVRGEVRGEVRGGVRAGGVRGRG